MIWHFTPEDVMHSKIEYSLVDFEEDLRAEARLNCPDLEEKDFEAVYNLIFSVCLCRALGYPQEDLEDCYESIEPELLMAIKEHNKENTDMLREILLKAWMDYIKSGFSEKDAAMVIKAIQHRKYNEELD